MDVRTVTSQHRPRRVAGLGVVILGVLATLLPASTLAGVSYPNSIASTGDSITRAYNTSWFPFVDNPSASWSTGTTSSVNSHYTRLLAANPLIKGRNYNDAKSGAKMTDLAGQMGTVVTQQAQYVTVLMGGNDICTSTEAGMTSTADFQTQFKAAMDRVTAGDPTGRVFVASIPSIYQLWATLSPNSSARSTWALFGVCQSMLANPLSTAQADVDRRTRVNQREQAFNTILHDVCALYTQCLYDGGAVYAYRFSAADISTRDYFHPSTTGQKDLAGVTWAASYWGGP